MSNCRSCLTPPMIEWYIDQLCMSGCCQDVPRRGRVCLHLHSYQSRRCSLQICSIQLNIKVLPLHVRTVLDAAGSDSLILHRDLNCQQQFNPVLIIVPAGVEIDTSQPTPSNPILPLIKDLVLPRVMKCTRLLTPSTPCTTLGQPISKVCTLCTAAAHPLTSLRKEMPGTGNQSLQCRAHHWRHNIGHPPPERSFTPRT